MTGVLGVANTESIEPEFVHTAKTCDTSETNQYSHCYHMKPRALSSDEVKEFQME